MKALRKSNERGHLNFGWLDARHSFSFGSYFDPKYMGFSVLRVINDDVIDEGMGFGTHPHKDMEIITFIKKGTLKHEDTLGNSSVIRPGEIQIMSAGSGIQHSEFNPDPKEKTHSYQIWIMPNENGVPPRYDQFNYEDRKLSNGLTLLVSPEGGEGIASIHADARLSLGSYSEGHKDEIALDSKRSYWLQMIEGELTIDGQVYESGDGLAIKDEKKLGLVSSQKSEFLFFDLP